LAELSACGRGPHERGIIRCCVCGQNEAKVHHSIFQSISIIEYVPENLEDDDRRLFQDDSKVVSLDHTECA
jgi:hypothetical protein